MQVPCRRCGQITVVPCTDEQLERWRGGALIQDAMPNLSPDEREVLISGFCGKCFDEITAEPELEPRDLTEAESEHIKTHASDHTIRVTPGGSILYVYYTEDATLVELDDEKVWA